MCIEKLELSTLENGIVLEIAFGLGHVLVGLLINKVGKFPIICKSIYNLFIYLRQRLRRVNIFCDFFFESVFILFVCGLSGIGCMLTDVPALQIYFFISLLTSGVATNVVSSATVELYPTSLR